jgi:hypothetical protein
VSPQLLPPLNPVLWCETHRKHHRQRPGCDSCDTHQRALELGANGPAAKADSEGRRFFDIMAAPRATRLEVVR